MFFKLPLTMLAIAWHLTDIIAWAVPLSLHSFANSAAEPGVRESTKGSALRQDSGRKPRRAQRFAFMVIDGEKNRVPCRLREYSDEGALVTMGGWIGIPESFALQVEPDGILYDCRIVAKRNNAIRVTFENASPARSR